MPASLTARIFNIQSYCIHDGPGIRSTVFFKGCPLRCLWCQNPESQRFEPELLCNLERCVGCGACVPACPQGAISIADGKARTDRKKCISCGACVSVCPHGVRALCGQQYTVEEVFQAVSRHKLFYESSGGGVTVSGGEALCFADFVCALFEKCRATGIHTALDTCGHVPWQVLERTARYTDLYLYDLKHMDSSTHRRLTGVPNRLILENVEKLVHLGNTVCIRIPLIPGLNDQPENLEATADFVCQRLQGKPQVFLLPYHRMGESKLLELGREGECLGLTPPSDAYMQELLSIFTRHGLSAQVGG